jgi:hypothetical protein
MYKTVSDSKPPGVVQIGYALRKPLIGGRSERMWQFPAQLIGGRHRQRVMPQRVRFAAESRHAAAQPAA